MQELATAQRSVGSGSCYGDSGGPIFYSDNNMITAVVSWGITPCIGNSYRFRIDTAVAFDFVRLFLQSGPPQSSDDPAHDGVRADGRPPSSEISEFEH